MSPGEPPDSAGDATGGWPGHETPWGTLRLRPGSLAALALDPTRVAAHRRERIERGAMDWRLGNLADLLWMLVPESRSIIFELAREAFADAIVDDEFLAPISEAQLATEVRRRLLVPALADLTAQRDVAARILGVLHRVVQETGTDYRDIFEPEILAPVAGEGLSDALAEVAPELIALTQELWR